MNLFPRYNKTVEILRNEETLFERQAMSIFMMQEGEVVRVNEGMDRAFAKMRPLINALADLELDIGSLNNLANTLEVSSVVAAWAEDYVLQELRSEVNSIRL